MRFHQEAMKVISIHFWECKVKRVLLIQGSVIPFPAVLLQCAAQLVQGIIAIISPL
jgi:hypothetical protein